ncbi:MAG: VanZ family protein [Taibaiella sp.]|nr:VanZ family protein [Taibaiella sp.]
MPAANVPRVDVPLADKWVHFTFFAGFTFLWLCAKPVTKPLWLFSMLSMGVAFGSLIELLQGAIPTLGRAAEVMDAVADSIGGLIGITIFAVCGAVVRHR